MEELSEHPLCLSCLTPHREEDHFCDHCGAPLDGYAATGPIERIHATGHVLRTAVNGPRKPFVTAGLCISSLIFAIGGILVAFEPHPLWSQARGINHLTVCVIAGIGCAAVPLRLRRNNTDRDR